MQPQTPRVSVVLSTFNRCHLLGHALGGLQNQQNAPPHEIIVVDNRSTDRTAAVVEAFIRESRGDRLTYVYESRQGLSYARNAGIARARGEIIAFTDDDVVADSGWIAAIADAFERHPDAAYVGGRVLPRWSHPPPAWLTPVHWSPLALQDHGETSFEVGTSRPICLVGANMAFRSSVFARVGLFSPDVQLTPETVTSTEDHELMRRVWGYGGHGVYDPAILVHADVPADRLTRRYHRRWHYDQGRFQARMRIPDMERSRARVLDVPVHLFRQAAVDAVDRARHWRARDSPAVFQAETRLCFFAGFVRERILARSNAPAPAQTLPALDDRLLSEGPIVSVVIPCHNQAPYLAEAIGSVLDQRHPRTEIVVVDDGSTDGTSDVAARFPEVRCLRQPRRGLAEARNAGLAAARGRFLVFLDADDRLTPGAIARGLQALRDSAGAAMACGRPRVVSAAGEPMFTGPEPEIGADPYAALLRSNPIWTPATVIFRRDAIGQIGGFDATLDAAADYDVYLRLARQFPVAVHSEVTAEYRHHAASMSRNAGLMLRSVLAVHRRQWRHARADPARRQAYREGRAFWQRFFGDQTMDVVRASVRSGEYGRALSNLFVMARRAPGRLAWHARRWLCNKWNGTLRRRREASTRFEQEVRARSSSTRV